MIVGYPNQGRKYEAEPPAASDDHLENHLLNEENRRLKDELRRAGTRSRWRPRCSGRTSNSREGMPVNQLSINHFEGT